MSLLSTFEVFRTASKYIFLVKVVCAFVGALLIHTCLFLLVPIILGHVSKSLGLSMSAKDLGSLPGPSFKERCHYSTFRRDASKYQ